MVIRNVCYNQIYIFNQSIICFGGTLHRENSTDVLCIAEWNGTISFYSIAGKPVGKDRSLNFIPLRMCNFMGGQYILISGSNKQCLLMTYDGIQLINVGGTFSSWIWSCTVHPTSTHIVRIYVVSNLFTYNHHSCFLFIIVY